MSQKPDTNAAVYREDIKNGCGGGRMGDLWGAVVLGLECQQNGNNECESKKQKDILRKGARDLNNTEYLFRVHWGRWGPSI